MQQADRNRLDRIPTRGERWVGIILSALLVAAFIPASIFVFLRAPNAQEHQMGLTIFASVLALIGMVGAFFLFRIAFTKPEAASARAYQIYAKVGVVVTALLVVVSVARPAPISQVLTSLALLFAALGMLANARRNRVATKRRRTEDGAL